MSEARILLHEPWPDRSRERQGYTFAMWLFLATEVLFFGGLFLLYAVNRWAYPEGVDQAARKAAMVFGTANTAVLMTSSLSFAIAERALEQKLKGVARTGLWVTLLLGLAFLVIKGFEYWKDLDDHLWPGPDFSVSAAGGVVFWSFYWIATFVHACHVTIGIGLIIRLILLSHRRKLQPREMSMSVTTLYWHLVDIIWVVLYPLIYLVGRP